jgi:hypothetical protein
MFDSPLSGELAAEDGAAGVGRVAVVGFGEDVDAGEPGDVHAGGDWKLCDVARFEGSHELHGRGFGDEGPHLVVAVEAGWSGSPWVVATLGVILLSCRSSVARRCWPGRLLAGEIVLDASNPGAGAAGSTGLIMLPAMATPATAAHGD